MAHYAFLDDNNIVTEVIVGIDETELIEGVDPETWYGNFRGQRCIRTSYNHKIRGHYAGLGDRYNDELNIFVSPQPFPSYTMNAAGHWDSPVPYPTDGKQYTWNETDQKWVPVD